MNIDPTVCSPYPPDDPPVVFDPAWRTETVRLLASGIEAERAFDRLPILADALEEAGCDVPAILNHCRLCSSHEWGCWVVTRVLARTLDPRNDSRVRLQLREEDKRVRQAVADINRPRLLRASQPGWTERYAFRFVIAFVVVVIGGVVLHVATRPTSFRSPATTPDPLRTPPSYDWKAGDTVLDMLRELDRQKRPATPATSPGAARPTKGER